MEIVTVFVAPGLLKVPRYVLKTFQYVLVGIAVELREQPVRALVVEGAYSPVVTNVDDRVSTPGGLRSSCTPRLSSAAQLPQSIPA